MARTPQQRSAVDDTAQFSLRRRDSPAGPERLVWSYLAALLALVVVGLGFAITDGVEPAFCDSDDTTCMLGVYVAGSLVSGLLGTGLAAWLLRLGWEWWLIVAAAVVTLPAALDLLGPFGWALVVLAPAFAALATLNGPRRARWRPWVIGVASGAWIVFMLLVVFVL